MGASASRAKQGRIELTHTIRNADECVDALSRALEAMEPPLDVYEVILRMIAEFTPYVHFFEFRLSYFDISDDGLTATRNEKSGGVHSNDCYGITVRPHITRPSRRLIGTPHAVSVTECTFRVDKRAYGAFGVARAGRNNRRRIADIMYLYWRGGSIDAVSNGTETQVDTVKKYRVGDMVTVRLTVHADPALGLDTVGFLKNGAIVGRPSYSIASGRAFWFVFTAVIGGAATIVDMK